MKCPASAGHESSTASPTSKKRARPEAELASSASSSLAARGAHAVDGDVAVIEQAGDLAGEAVIAGGRVPGAAIRIFSGRSATAPSLCGAGLAALGDDDGAEVRRRRS